MAASSPLPDSSDLDTETADPVTASGWAGPSRPAGKAGIADAADRLGPAAPARLPRQAGTTSTRRGLGPEASYRTAAWIITLCLWGSSAPSLLYPVYADVWDLTPTVTTTVFAGYPVGLIVMLFLAGGVSDRIGRRPALLATVVTMALSCVVFLVADGLAWLYAGRLLQGLATGLALPTAGAALLENDTRRSPARVSLTTTLGNAVGLAMGLVVTGFLVQYAPLQRQLSFVILLVLTVLTLPLVIRMPGGAPGAHPAPGGHGGAAAGGTAAGGAAHSSTSDGSTSDGSTSDGSTSGGRTSGSGAAESRRRGLSQWLAPVGVPAGLRWLFLVAALPAAVVNSVGALYLALGGQMFREIVDTSNAAVSGLGLSVAMVTLIIAAVLLRGWGPHTGIVVGGVAGAASLAALGATDATGLLVLFIVTGVFNGVSYSLCFAGALRLVNQSAHPQHRAQLLGALYLVIYASQGIVAVAAGLDATHHGLHHALMIAAPLLGVLLLAGSVLGALDLRRHRSPTAAVAVPHQSRDQAGDRTGSRTGNSASERAGTPLPEDVVR